MNIFSIRILSIVCITLLFSSFVCSMEQNAKAQLILETKAADLSQVAKKIKMDELELEKTNLEIEKIKLEISSFSTNGNSQNITLGIALISMLISAWIAFQSNKTNRKSLESQLKQNREEHIASLLNNLSNERQDVKLAAIRSLSEYRESYDFLCDVLNFENERKVVNTVINCLKKDVEYSIPLLIESSASIKQRLMECVVKLITCKVPKQDAVDSVELSLKDATEWLQSSKGKRATKIQSSLMQSLGSTELQKVQDNTKSEILKLQLAFSNHLLAFESLIKLASSKKVKLEINKAFMKDILLRDMDLSGWKFIDCDIRNGDFRGSTCKSTGFIRTNLNYSNFKSVNISEAKFQVCAIREGRFINSLIEGADFFDCDLRHSKFIEAYGDKPKFIESNLDSADLSDVNLRFVDFGKCSMKGSNLLGSNLFEPDFSHANAQGCKTNDSSLERIISNANQI